MVPDLGLDSVPLRMGSDSRKLKVNRGAATKCHRRALILELNKSSMIVYQLILSRDTEPRLRSQCLQMVKCSFCMTGTDLQCDMPGDTRAAMKAGAGTCGGGLSSFLL